MVQYFTEPISHSTLFPFPVCPKHSHPQSQTFESSDGSDGDFELRKKIVPLSQSEMNDWIRDMELTKDKAEILTSGIKERNFVTPDVSVTYYKNRHNPFSKYFTLLP